MGSISHADYLSMQARLTKSPPEGKTPGCDDESQLHNQILLECRKRGWLAFHGSMAHKTFRTPGEPDVLLVIPGRTLFIELKTKSGKLSTEQLGVEAWLRKLGHKLHVVRSFEQFLSIVNK